MPRKRVLDLPVAPTHKLSAGLRERPIHVALVGCGGNGAQMLTKLARLDHALRATTNPHGLRVSVFDPDVVSPANIGRQLFSPSDIGLHKATVLVHRINAFYGLDWLAFPTLFDGGVPSVLGVGTYNSIDVVVSCVDTAKARRQIAQKWAKESLKAPRYWLDLGNRKTDGQVILGQPKECHWNALEVGTQSSEDFVAGNRRVTPAQMRLPTVVEVFPELLDAKIKEDDAPSCSVADALDKQGLFVNDHVTSWAAQLLDDLLRVGQIAYHGAFINLATGRVNALPVPKPQVVEIEKAA